MRRLTIGSLDVCDVLIAMEVCAKPSAQQVDGAGTYLGSGTNTMLEGFADGRSIVWISVHLVHCSSGMGTGNVLVPRKCVINSANFTLGTSESVNFVAALAV